MDERLWRREFIRLSILESSALRYFQRARKVGNLERMARAERLRSVAHERARALSPNIVAYR
jgi:hypothetical protein